MSKTNRFALFKETIGICYECDEKHTNTKSSCHWAWHGILMKIIASCTTSILAPWVKYRYGTVYTSVSHTSSREGTHKVIVHMPRNASVWKRTHTYIHTHTHTHSHTVVSPRRLFQCSQLPDKTFLAIFGGIFIIFCVLSKQLCIYSTSSLESPDGFPWNPIWETLAYTVLRNLHESLTGSVSLATTGFLD